MMRRRLAVLLSLPVLLAVAALPGCAPTPKPPPVLTLAMTGGADQNPDASGKASPVAVRVFQLTATAKFERADFFALTDREQQTLGADSAGSQEFVLAPSERRTLTIELKPMVQAVGVAVFYRDIDHAQWRAVAPVATSGPTNLSLAIGRLAVTLKPAP